MSYILLFLVLGSSTIISAETSSVLDRVKERLISSAKQKPMTNFAELPDAAFYINHDLITNAPHKLNLNKELTTVIREWSPRLLALDPTCPYYFSKFSDDSSSETDLNLLSYLQAIEENKTTASPFVNILPQSYRNAIPLPSIFHCSELIYPKSTPFFHNVELIIGPGQTELPLKRLSDVQSQLWCSLFGLPHVVLINQSKQPTVTYDAQKLLAEDSNLADVEFSLASLEPNFCLFVPSDWVIGGQLNNSISLVFTLNKIEKSIVSDAEEEPLPCTATGTSKLETIEFSMVDTFNLTEIGLIVYFYQYLNPPIFDKKFTRNTFFEEVQQDKNVSQLIMKWTPELMNLIKLNLFDQLDINHDEKFSSDDYFEIKQENLLKLQNSILDILERIRHNVLAQYNELNEGIVKITETFGNMESEENFEETLRSMMENLPEQVKEQLKQNPDIEKILEKGKPKRPRRPPMGKNAHVRKRTDSMIFEEEENKQTIPTVDQEIEEEITAEPITNGEQESHRTDL